MITEKATLLNEARAISECHPSKDARFFAESVVVFLNRNGWVHVNERQPSDEFENVLFTGPLASIEILPWVDAEAEDLIGVVYDHWQPLPDPPKEG